MASDSSDDSTLDPATKSAIREEFERLYEHHDERIESEIKTFINQRAVEELLTVADDLERVEEVQEELDTVEERISGFYSDIDDIEDVLNEARSLSGRVATLEREIARTRAELGSQLDSIEVMLSAPELADDAYTSPDEVNTEPGGGEDSPVIDDAQTALMDFESNVTEDPEEEYETEDAFHPAPDPDGEEEPYLQLQLQDGTVIDRRYDHDGTPRMRDEFTVDGTQFRVRRVRHIFNDETDEKEYIMVEVS